MILGLVCFVDRCQRPTPVADRYRCHRSSMAQLQGTSDFNADGDTPSSTAVPPRWTLSTIEQKRMEHALFRRAVQDLRSSLSTMQQHSLPTASVSAGGSTLFSSRGGSQLVSAQYWSALNTWTDSPTTQQLVLSNDLFLATDEHFTGFHRACQAALLTSIPNLLCSPQLLVRVIVSGLRWQECEHLQCSKISSTRASSASLPTRPTA